MEDGDQIDAFLEQVGAFLWIVHAMAHANVVIFSWVVVVMNHRYHDPPPTYPLYIAHLFVSRSSLVCILVGLFNANNFQSRIVT